MLEMGNIGAYSTGRERAGRRSRSRNGFTLIELLVVIAIIAILASILFPVFESARENARKTACLSNLKQMGIGVLQYEQDFDEYLPLATFYNNGQEQYVWMDAIYPYIKNTQILPVPASPPL